MYLRELIYKFIVFARFLQIIRTFDSFVSFKGSGGTLSKLKLKGWCKVNFSLKADMTENKSESLLEYFETLAHCETVLNVCRIQFTLMLIAKT